MIARVACIALDARAMVTDSPRERALAARWIAANLLAAQGVRIEPSGSAPEGPCMFSVHAKSFTAALAAIAVVPALFDPATLPVSWWLAIRAIGMPVADRAISLLLAGGASVAVVEPHNGNAAVIVDTDYRVAIDRASLLVA